MRHDTTKTSVQKYCTVCGRLVSPHVRNYEERKHCSKACSGTRLTELDRQIEDEFVRLSLERGEVECGEVQDMFRDKSGLHSLRQAQQAEEPDRVQAVKTRAGQDEAAFRERVRRAARRVVVNGRDGEKFLCWSQGQPAEASFAKGEWSVKHIRS